MVQKEEGVGAQVERKCCETLLGTQRLETLLPVSHHLLFPLFILIIFMKTKLLKQNKTLLKKLPSLVCIIITNSLTGPKLLSQPPLHSPPHTSVTNICVALIP